MFIFLTTAVMVWLAAGSCVEKSDAKLPEADRARFTAAGDTLTKMAFAALSAELQGAIQRGGIEEALKHCNVRAHPLTDSLAAAHGAGLRRVSKKWRNRNNKADKLEEFIAKGYANDQNQKKTPEPKLVLKTDTLLYYKPIIVQGLCLNCHGTPGKELRESHDRLIRQLYPGDKAVGYRQGDVRGLWRVAFFYPGQAGDSPR
jgi:hypothetical protein